jgi:hypothetical protein
VERIRPFCVWFHKDREKILEAANEKEGKLGAKERKRKRESTKEKRGAALSFWLSFILLESATPADITEPFADVRSRVRGVALKNKRPLSLFRSLVFQSAR